MSIERLSRIKPIKPFIFLNVEQYAGRLLRLLLLTQCLPIGLQSMPGSQPFSANRARNSLVLISVTLSPPSPCERTVLLLEVSVSPA